MASKSQLLAAEKVEVVQNEDPTVRVFLPLAEQDDSNVAVDQFDTVTINGVNTRIKRGEYVNVSVPVFIQLRNRYPNI